MTDAPVGQSTALLEGRPAPTSRLGMLNAEGKAASCQDPAADALAGLG